MEGKQWLCGILLAFILAGLFVNLFVHDSHEVQSSLTGWELKSTIASMVRGGWYSSGNEVTLDLPTKEKQGSNALSPNLTSCHESINDDGHRVYCCPPNSKLEEPFIDFQFPDPSSPLRVRRPAYLIDDEYRAKYNKGLSIMKSLPYDDPRSFKRFADLHCLYCTGSYNQQNSNSIFFIHRTRLFYPFHRMMIYFHEKIIGNLIGDDTFALPFWNWDNPAGMSMPDMYMNGSFIDTNRDYNHLPPHIADLNYADVDTGLSYEEQIATNLPFMYHQMVSGAKKTELFMGCPIKPGKEGYCDGPGTVELAPHNTVHCWLGSNLSPHREDSGSFLTAARDPMFYAHHSNIDRLWEVWRELNGNKLDIVDPIWLDSHFFFHNEHSQLVRVKVRDVLDITKLGYAYEKVDLPWLNARPKPSMPPKIARHILKMRDNQNGLRLPSQIESADFGPEGRTLDTTIRVRVHRTRTQRSKKEKEEEEEVLVVYGINVKKDVFVKFDVYVNVVDETIVGPESREFAGSFVNMRRGASLVMNEGDDVVERKTKLKLGISELSEDLEAEGDESIWVTLVPRGGSGVNTNIGGVRIEYMR